MYISEWEVSWNSNLLYLMNSDIFYFILFKNIADFNSLNFMPAGYLWLINNYCSRSKTEEKKYLKISLSWEREKGYHIKFFFTFHLTSISWKNISNTKHLKEYSLFISFNWYNNLWDKQGKKPPISKKKKPRMQRIKGLA